MVELSALEKHRSAETEENEVVLLIKMSNFGEFFLCKTGKK